jgi:hypothetical protein
LNFLDLLRAGHTDFVLNDTAFDYMRIRALPAMLITSLAAQPERMFADQAGWSAQLDRLGFTGLTTTPDPVQIAIEGARPLRGRWLRSCARPSPGEGWWRGSGRRGGGLT